jgi:hypothetical protein
MGNRALALLLAVTVGAFAFEWSQVANAQSEEKLPSKSDSSCLKCHQYDKQFNLLAGKLVNVSAKAKTLQLAIDKDMEVIHFDDKTVLKNASSFKEIPKAESIRITYAKLNGKIYAREVEVKKGLEVPKEKLASVEEVAKLVALGPEKGEYVLVDSRPGNNYDEGHIPTAKKMPFFMFDQLKDKVLPQDKSILQVYYCSGFS